MVNGSGFQREENRDQLHRRNITRENEEVSKDMRVDIRGIIVLYSFPLILPTQKKRNPPFNTASHNPDSQFSTRSCILVLPKQPIILKAFPSSNGILRRVQRGGLASLGLLQIDKRSCPIPDGVRGGRICSGFETWLCPSKATSSCTVDVRKIFLEGGSSESCLVFDTSWSGAFGNLCLV